MRMPAALQPVRGLTRGIADLLLPQTCVACGEWIRSESGLACDACRAAIADLAAATYCAHCGRGAVPATLYEGRCGGCRKELFWNVAGVARLGRYTEPLSTLLVGHKFAGHDRNARYLASEFADALRGCDWLEEVELLVPVPMHWKRRLQRRCDHAAVLTDALSRELRIPVRKAVRRSKYSITQMRTPSRTQRFENVKGCFVPARRPRVTGKTVCIVDNLLMTGATVYEVSKVLRKSGAKRIYAAVVARGVLPGDFQAQVETPLIPDDSPA